MFGLVAGVSFASLLAGAQADPYRRGDFIFMAAYIASWLALVTLALASPFMLIRGIARWLLRERWYTRYIRVAFDVALMGLIVLCVKAISPEQGVGGHLPSFMREQIETANRLLRLQRTYLYCPQPLTDAELKLEKLTTASWFLEHFPLYVVLPGAIVFLAGYSSERAKKIKGR